MQSEPLTEIHIWCDASGQMTIGQMDNGHEEGQAPVDAVPVHDTTLNHAL